MLGVKTKLAKAQALGINKAQERNLRQPLVWLMSDSYVSWIFLQRLATTSLFFMLLFSFQAAFPEIVDQRYPLNQILIFHGLNLAKVFVDMFAPATLLALLLTFSQLQRSHELIAFFSIGLGLRRLLGVCFIWICLSCCFIVWAQDSVLPQLFRSRTTYYWSIMKQKTDFFLDVKREKIWYRSNQMIYNLESFDPGTDLIRGMSIFVFDQDFELKERIVAARARFEEGQWQLEDGLVSLFIDGQSFPKTQRFEKKRFLIAEKPKEFQEIEKEAEGLTSAQLLKYIHKLGRSGVNTQTYEVRFHSRLATALIPLVMGVLAIPFLGGGRREGGMVRNLGICFLVTFSYWLFVSLGLSLGNKGSVAPWVAAWLPSVLVLGCATLMLARKKTWHF